MKEKTKYKVYNLLTGPWWSSPYWQYGGDEMQKWRWKSRSIGEYSKLVAKNKKWERVKYSGLEDKPTRFTRNGAYIFKNTPCTLLNYWIRARFWYARKKMGL